MSWYFSVSRSALKQIIQSLKENPNKQTHGCDSDMLILYHDILVEVKGREQKVLDCRRRGWLFETHTVPQPQSGNAAVTAPGSAKNEGKKVPVLSSLGARGCCTATTSLPVGMIEDKEKERSQLLLQSQWCWEERA